MNQRCYLAFKEYSSKKNLKWGEKKNCWWKVLREKKKPTRRVWSDKCWCQSLKRESGSWAETGQGRGQGKGSQWEWSKAARQHIFVLFFFSLFFLFFWNHSLTPSHHQALLFSDWEMQGHWKLQIDHWTTVTCHDGPATKGMFTVPEYTLQFNPKGHRGKNLDRLIS